MTFMGKHPPGEGPDSRPDKRLPAAWDREIELPPARGRLTGTFDESEGEMLFQIEGMMPENGRFEWITAHESDCVPEDDWA